MLKIAYCWSDSCVGIFKKLDTRLGRSETFQDLSTLLNVFNGYEGTRESNRAGAEL